MNKSLYALTAAVGLVSCASSYNIEGTLNPSDLDGQKVYLKVFSQDAEGFLASVDSCEVMHGKFAFSGSIDSTQWANIVMDRTLLVPVVLESGDIVVRIDNTQRSISGTPQNDQINTFFRSFLQYANQLDEADRSEMQMIMKGMTEQEAYQRAGAQKMQILSKADKQFTSFISSNYDNAAGPCAFWVLTTSGFGDQVWADALLSSASTAFKSDGFVKFYCDETKRMQELMNGTAMPVGDGSSLSAAPPMTPNEMAGDSVK